MANARSGNTFYIDSASSSAVPQSYVSKKPVVVTQIVFTSSAAGDSVTVCDMDPSGGILAGPNKFTVAAGVAKDTKVVRLDPTNASFPNGIWVSAISSGATATVVFTNQGSG